MSELKHKILAVAKKVEAVSEPELGLTLYVRRMNGHERDQYHAAGFKAETDAKTQGDAALQVLKPLLLSLTLCDDKGVRLFDAPTELQEVDALVLDRLAARAMEINGLTEASRAALEKKLTEPTGSGSSLPTVSDAR